MFREGHERLGAGVVLRAPDGSQLPLATMRELAPGTDRYGADVTIPAEGRWQFRVEAWGDPIAGGSTTRPSRSRSARTWT